MFAFEGNPGLDAGSGRFRHARDTRRLGARLCADAEEPAVVRIVGQLGGYGPVVSSELEGASFGK